LPLSVFLTNLGRFDEAEAVLQAAAEQITELGHTAYASSPLLFRAVLRLAEGRLDDATAEAEAGLAIAEETGARAFTLLAIVVRIIVAVRRGDCDAVTSLVEHYTAQKQASQGLMLLRAWGDWGMALVADAHGDPRRAMDLLEAPYTDQAERSWLLMSEASAAAWLTRTALAVTEPGKAEMIVATAERLANDNPEFTGLAASAALAHGIFHDDPAALAKAAETYPGPWNRASAAEDLGLLFARATGASSREAAIRSLDQALEGYQRTGALRDAARIRARLRELGVRRRHWNQAERPISGWASLTDTERNVAVLVARGLTNPQVARQMFISPHTVKFHLTQVFRKLAIGSRVELARLAIEYIEEATPPRA
jgi:DNA-binding CsgD family transcriptional regulator